MLFKRCKNSKKCKDIKKVFLENIIFNPILSQNEVICKVSSLDIS